MMEIAYLGSLSRRKDAVRDAVWGAAKHIGANVRAPLDHLSYQDESIHDVWRLLERADLVVAHVARTSSNLFYEIGVAHGLRKPVFIVADAAVALPLDLRGQRVLTYDRKRIDRDQLSFVVKENLLDVARNAKTSLGVLGLGEVQSDSNSSLAGALSLKKIAARPAIESVLEGQVYDLLSAVPDWEITPASVRERARTFDFVVWSKLHDPTLAPLGNPIAVEVKGAGVTSEQVRRIASEAEKSGLQCVLLFAGVATWRTRPSTLDKAFHRHGVYVIVFDIEDMSRMRNTDLGLVQELRKRLLALRSS